jgi:rod shape-determining protein MreC
MREFLQSWKFKIIICIFALMFGFMIHAAVNSGAASVPEMVLRSIMSPFARASSVISSFVETNLDTVINAGQIDRENKELREIISELHRQHINVAELSVENALLREMLKISEAHPDFEWTQRIVAVSAWNANDVFGGFTINRGTNDGIGLHDLVITGVGVVGIIREVAPHYSRVTSVISTETNVGVTAVRSNVTGVTENSLVYARDGFVRVNFFDKDVDVREGDVIMTRGSGMFPSNQLIGEVEEVRDDPNGVSRYALVRPAEELLGLTHVFVITGFEGRDTDE